MRIPRFGELMMKLGISHATGAQRCCGQIIVAATAVRMAVYSHWREWSATAEAER